ncbi:MAG: DUF456 domain-containing protein [Candidatus Promineifilaceae bacterium]
MLNALLFGFAVVLLIVGLVGTVVPILPGSVLMLFTVLFYGYSHQWQEPSVWITVVMVLILLSSGSADIWLPSLGIKTGGSSWLITILGMVGGIIGTFYGPFVGSILGYAIGVLLGSLYKYGDVRLALRTSLFGVAGQGAASVVQFAGGVVVLIIFVSSIL